MVDMVSRTRVVSLDNCWLREFRVQGLTQTQKWNLVFGHMEFYTGTLPANSLLLSYFAPEVWFGQLRWGLGFWVLRLGSLVLL